MTGFATLLYEKKGRLAQITLNRSRVLNAYNIQMRDELYQVLSAIRDDPEVGVVILKGEGRAFCVGADLTEFGTAPSPIIARQVRWERDVWGLFLSLKPPVIAALHGYVLGSGIEMALCCDLRLAAEGTRFGMPEVSLGFIPAAGGTQTVPRHLLLGRALELLLTSRQIDTQKALEWGLVNRVVPPGELLTVAEAWAQRLLSLGPLAVPLAKEAVTRGLDLSLREGLALESKLASRLLDTEDAREGIQAFLEKRKPRFRGQ